MSTPEPTVTVLIASYRRETALARCLAFVRTQDRSPDEVIVVGQGDDAGTRDVLEASRPPDAGEQWRYVHVATPGIVGAENAGVAAARGEVVAFVDDDASPRPDWLRRLAAWYAEPAVGGVGGPYVEHEHGKPVWEEAREVGTYKWFGRYVSRQWCLTAAPRRVDVLTGTNMSFRRLLIPRLPGTLRPYWNAFEVYLCGAVRRRGYQIVFDPAARVNHYPEARVRHYTFRYRDEAHLRRCLYRDNAHNFIYATLSQVPLRWPALFLAYEFLVGDAGRPGLVRAALLAAQGRGREAWEGLGPSWRGRLAGLGSYLAERAAVRRRREASLSARSQAFGGRAAEKESA